MIDKFTGSNGFLSNFYRSDIPYEGINYPTAEHAFQAAKCSTAQEKLRISAASTPGMARTMGRHVRLRSDWEDVKDSIMEDILRIKFKDEALKQRLIGTGKSILIEGNTWGDRYWGVCSGKGKNKLGKLLMKIRESI